MKCLRVTILDELFISEQMESNSKIKQYYLTEYVEKDDIGDLTWFT